MILPTSQIVKHLQKNIFKNCDAAKAMSDPVLRFHKNKCCIAVFVFFLDNDTLINNSLKRPEKWCLANLFNGDIIAEYDCHDYDFSDAAFDERITVGSDFEDIDVQAAYSILDCVRSEIINHGKFPIDTYEKYLAKICSGVPVEYRRFFKELSL